MTKNLTGICQHCAGAIEFPADQAGQTAPCPHCHEETELLLAIPPEETSPLKARAIIFISLAVLILVGGLVGAQLAVKRARRITGQDSKPVGGKTPATPTDPIAQAGFQVSPVALEKSAGSTLVYAVGIVTETARRKHFGVRVELALFDREGKACGSAQDYQANLEPGSQWKYRALVVNAQAVRATVLKVSEEK